MTSLFSRKSSSYSEPPYERNEVYVNFQLTKGRQTPLVPDRNSALSPEKGRGIRSFSSMSRTWAALGDENALVIHNQSGRQSNIRQPITVPTINFFIECDLIVRRGLTFQRCSHSRPVPGCILTGQKTELAIRRGDKLLRLQKLWKKRCLKSIINQSNLPRKGL